MKESFENAIDTCEAFKTGWLPLPEVCNMKGWLIRWSCHTVGSEVYYLSFSVKEKHRLHHCGTKVSLKMLISYDLHSGEGSTGQLLIAYWHDLENNVAFDVHVKSFQSKA